MKSWFPVVPLNQPIDNWKIFRRMQCIKKEESPHYWFKNNICKTGCIDTVANANRKISHSFSSSACERCLPGKGRVCVQWLIMSLDLPLYGRNCRRPVSRFAVVAGKKDRNTSIYLSMLLCLQFQWELTPVFSPVAIWKDQPPQLTTLPYPTHTMPRQQSGGVSHLLSANLHLQHLGWKCDG